MGQTLVEKVVQRYAVGLSAGHQVRSGEYVTIRPKHVMTHDNTGAVMPKFRSIGAGRIHNPRQPVFCLDHDVQNRSEKNLAKYGRIEAFAREQGVDFHPAGSGIGHQIMIEEGYALPGTLVVASDSHSNLYGGIGALGTPVVRTDAAAIWATGTTWWEIPPIAKVTLTGELRPGSTGKDVIIALCGVYNQDEVLNHAVEFHGPGLASLSVEQRLTIANMTTEWGALVGLFAYDEVTREYLNERARLFAERGDSNPRITDEVIARCDEEALAPDPDAGYAVEIEFDLGEVTPHVSGPNEVKMMVSLAEMEKRKLKVNKAYLLSCVNARLGDFAEASAIVKGKKVATGVEFYIAPASAAVQKEAEKRGYWQTLLEAGAIPLPAGCGPCIGLGVGTLEAGQVGISATNRNFKGRMGSRDAEVYLSSPAVVAASAIAGYICAPAPVEAQTHTKTITVHKVPPQETSEVSILEGFPEKVGGELLFLPKDNMNTDGIYGKDYTYKDDMSPEEMAKVAMLNYDPAFQEKAREGDILISGSNFGSGSSREQAATALKFRGIHLVIAASFSQTYKRNAFNNGFICIECPALVDSLKHEFTDDPTIRTGIRAMVDFKQARIEIGSDVYPFAPLGPVPQELVIAGGVENLVRERLKATPNDK